MSLKRLELILASLLLLLNSAISQNYSYKHYTIFDGMVQNQVTSLYQDSHGFIWIGTKAGASRFDGITFRNYTFKDGIPTGFMIGFAEDNEKNLFCITRNGYSVSTNGKFHFVSTFPGGDISKFYGPFTEALESFFIVCVGHSIYKCNKYGCRLYKDFPALEEVAGYFINKENKEYISSYSCFYKVKDRGELQKICDISINKMFDFPYGDYVATSKMYPKSNFLDSLYYFSQDKLFKRYGMHTQFYSFLTCRIDDDKIMFVKNNFEWLIVDTCGREVLRDNYKEFVTITALLQDNEGNIWIGAESGLFRLESFAFRNYTEDIGLDKYVWSVIEAPDSSIWFATYNSAIFQWHHGVMKRMKGYENLVTANNRFYMGGIRTAGGHMLFPNNDGIILDYYKGRFSSLFAKNKDFKIPTTLYIYEDTNRNLIYFGCTYNLTVYDEITGDVKSFKLPGLSIIKSLGRDKYERLWVCTADKIFLFDGRDFVDLGDRDKIFRKGAICCQKDSRGNMWLGNDLGLFVYSYQKVSQLFDVPFFFIKMYKDHYIIAGTVTGFYYIDIDKYYSGDRSFYRFFDRFNGFTGIECGQNGTCFDSKGNVWIPTSDRVVKFMPAKLTENKKEPATYIYNVSVAGKDLKWTNVLNEFNFSDTLIRFNHNKNNLSFDYNGISLTCPEKVVYKTRMLGYDERWSDVTNFNTVSFTNLDPGKYTFEVMSCNADGYWTKTPARLTFEITPAYWQTLWFRISAMLLSIILMTLTIYVIFRNKRIKEQKRIEVEKEIASMQVNTINAQLDPHFIFNAITAIGTEVQENNTEKAYAYFVKVSNLLRSSLTGNEKISRSLNDEIEFVKNYLVLQKYRFGERFEYAVNVDENIDLAFEVPKMCIQIFVENAIKHGLEHVKSGGFLNISVSVINKTLHAEITDNGIGRRRSAQIQGDSTGIGLQVFKRFFEILNRFNTGKAGFEIKDLYDKSGEPAGTKVIVKIPLDYRITF